MHRAVVQPGPLGKVVQIAFVNVNPLFDVEHEKSFARCGPGDAGPTGASVEDLRVHSAVPGTPGGKPRDNCPTVPGESQRDFGPDRRVREPLPGVRRRP